MSHARSSTRRRCTCVVLCVGPIALAGCGGGSSFVSQANDVCKTYTAKLNALATPTSIVGLASYLDRVLPLVTEGTAKLKAVKPPSSKASKYQAYISLREQEVALVQQADAAAHARNSGKAHSLSAQEGTLSSEDKVSAKSLGLGECAK